MPLLLKYSNWVIYVCLISLLASAQSSDDGHLSQLYLDSLQQELDQTNDETQQMELIWYIADEASWQGSEKVLDYCKQGIELADKLGDLNYRRDFLLWMGLAYDNAAEYAYAMDAYKKGLEIIELQQIDEEEDDIDLFTEEVYTQNNLGYVYFQLGNYKEALDHYFKGLKMAEDKSEESLPTVLGSLSELYFKMNDMAKAKENILKALKYSKDVFDVASNSRMLGDIYEVEGKPDSSFIFYRKAFELSKGQSDDYLTGMCIEGLVNYHLARGNYRLAFNFADFWRQNAAESNIQVYIIASQLALAKARIGMEEFELAKLHAENALSLSQSFKLGTSVAECYATLERIYVQQMDHKNAYKYKHLLQGIKDSIFNKEKVKYIAEAENLYLLQKKESENKILKAQQAEQNAVIMQRTSISIAAILFLALSIGIAYFLYINGQQRKRYNLLLENEVERRTADLTQTNEELERFNHIVSHDLKEPLRSIISFSSLCIRKVNAQQDTELSEYLTFIKRAAFQLNSLVTDIMEFTNVGNQPPEKKPVDLNQLLDKVKDSLNAKVKEKNGSIEFSKLPVIQSYQSLLYVLYKNIIENGLKYNESKQPQILVDFGEEESQYIFTIKDNGIGIPEEYRESVFDMFKRLHSRHEYSGSGMGLSICKKIAQKLGGDICVAASSNEGTTVQIVLPKV